MRVIFAPVAGSEFGTYIDRTTIDQSTSYTKAQAKSLLGSTDTTTKKVVVSILFTINDANGDTDFFGVNASPRSFNLKNLFDCISDRFFYRYKGQLTEGTCEDPVEWAVAREPIAISQTSYDALTSAATLTANA